MPPRKRFDKKRAQTYQVVYRSHDDALYYDNEASEHVIVPIGKHSKEPTNKHIYDKSDLAEQIGEGNLKNIRDNEGLAAQYGIFFDDSKYDYMQHLKPIGQNPDAIYIEKKEKKTHSKNLDELFEGQLPSKDKIEAPQVLQNIPPELEGFNPDLDPRIREVLEALEDEAYLEKETYFGNKEGREDNIEDYDNLAANSYNNNVKVAPEKEEEDIFDALLNSGQANDEEFYGDSDFEGEYDEWDVDNYEDEYTQKYDSDEFEEGELPYNAGEEPEEQQAGKQIKLNNAWERDFELFKKGQNKKINDWDSEDDFESENEDNVGDLPALPKTKGKTSKTKMRKKKGAMTDLSSFSMTSSAIFRTEGLTLLDDRYEQLSKKLEHEDEDEDDYQFFKIENERTDLNDMLDDFLDNYELESGGRKLVKKNSEKQKLQEAADSVSKSKLAARRKKEKTSTQKARDPLGGLGNSFKKLDI